MLGAMTKLGTAALNMALSTSTQQTVERATGLFQTALLYTISNAAISSLIETANASYIPMVVIAAFGGIGVALHFLAQIDDQGHEVLKLLSHILQLFIDILVQLASNGIGQLVLYAFVGSASISATILGVLISVILLWSLRQSIA